MGTKRPFLLYHWSPYKNRESIKHYGLCPGKLSKCGKWRPPYVCFAKSPSLAWTLAKVNCNLRWWDLWMVWSDCLDGYEIINKEYRIYHRIYKRNVWFVGTRSLR